MQLNDLKSTWQNAENASKSEGDLKRMTKITHLPRLKKIRTKMLIEVIGLTIFLLVYRDWFDGDNAPVHANVLLVGGLLLYILNNIIGFFSLLAPISGTNLKMSIQHYFFRIKRLAVLSLIISFAYGISVIVFFTSVIHFTRAKYFILAGIIATLLLMTYYSFNTWRRWIKDLQQQAGDFDFDGER